MYKFLLVFPPDESVKKEICSPQSHPEPLLRLESPYKALYSIYALRRGLDQQLQDVRINPNPLPMVLS